MNANPCFFLGANSPLGFCSFQSELIDIGEAHRIVYVKGGPGTGKSTLMRRIADLLEREGISCEYIYCSSDAHSLDGVVFPALKSAVLDGTAPHVGEPKYFGAVEEYFSVCPYVDLEAVRSHREAIVSLTDRIRSEFACAYRYIAAARALADYRFDLMLPLTDIERLSARGRSLAVKYIRGGTEGRLCKRFLTAISPQGLTGFIDRVSATCDQVITVSDPFGMAPFMLAPVLENARARKLEGYACYCPSNPCKLEHLLFPSLSLAFITVNSYHGYGEQKLRNISVVTAVDREAQHGLSVRLRSVLRTERGLYAEAVNCLENEKKLHDKLEQCYVPYLDTAGLQAAADALAAKLLR